MLKRSSILISLVCAIAFIFGCGNNAEKKCIIVKVPTLTMECVVDSKISSAAQFIGVAADKYMASHPDVYIDVQEFPIAEEERNIGETFGTNKAADVLYEDYFNMITYVGSGYVVPLDGIISEETRNDIDKKYWEQSVFNGKTYMMPYLARQNILAYNKDMFRSVGLDRYISNEPVIQNWNKEEWTDILDTLANNLPEGQYPCMMYAANEQGDTHIMMFLRATGCEFFNEKGEISLGEKGITMLGYLQEANKRNWFPPHPEYLQISNNTALFKNRQLAIHLVSNATINKVNIDRGFVNFPGNLTSAFITGFEVMDNGDPQRLQIAKDFVKFIYESPELMEYSAGNLPVSHRVTEKYVDTIPMLAEFDKNKVNIVDFTNHTLNWRGVRNCFWKHIHALLEGTITPEAAAAFIERDCNKAIQEGILNCSFHE